MRFRYFAKEKSDKIPKAPGVYAFKHAGGFLYIGKAANLRDRVKNHFQQSSYRDNLFVDQVAKVGYIETNSEIEALLLESKLIKEYQPRYNVMWRDDKGYFHMGISKEPLPRVFVTHQPYPETWNVKRETYKKVSSSRFHVSRYIGPFVDGKALKRTLRMMRGVFPYYTAKKHSPRPCQYCHLELCPGPAPNKKEYQKNIRNLIAVFEGKKTSVLRQLQKEMRTASQKQDFEKAAKLRDQMQDLEVIFSHARILRPGDEQQPHDWSKTEFYLKKILGRKRKISRVEAYDISNIQGKEATGSMPVSIDGKPAKDHYRKFKIRIAGKPNDFAMLKEVIGRRLAHPEWPYPDLLIIDGGKGQLSAVLKAIEETIKQTMHKFHDREKSVRKIRAIYVAAIAKKHNELFLPGQSKSLLLKNMPQSVSNFILHMRDEAHRFAISYHRKLRKFDLLGKEE